MAKLTIQQTADISCNVGFSGQRLIVWIAVLMGESGLDTHAINLSDPHGGSFGIAQINGAHFGEHFGPHGRYVMSQTVAFDPNLAILFSWELSNSGTNFSHWGAYSNGSYQRHIGAVQQALKNYQCGTTSEPVALPPYTGEPWYDFRMYSDVGGGPFPNYHNTDVGTPTDTPITAPLAGTVTELGYFPWGGQVTMKVDNPSAISGHKYDFVIHLDAISPFIKKGDHLAQGTFLGYSGGENSAKGLHNLPAGLLHHPTDKAHSSGPHLDIGVGDTPNANWDVSQGASNALVELARSAHIPFGTGILGPGGAGGNVGPDLTPPPGDTGTIGPLPLFPTLSQQIHHTLVQNPGFYGIADALDEAEHFPGFVNDMVPPDGMLDATGWGNLPATFLQSIADTVVGNTIPLVVRGALILAGIFLVAALMWQLVKPNLEALPQLLELGMLAA